MKTDMITEHNIRLTSAEIRSILEFSISISKTHT
jgi:hypothetical protein